MSKIVKTKRINRFSNPEYEKTEYDFFSFGNSLKSYNDDKLYFTNFVKTENNQCYKFLAEYVKCVLKQDYKFLKKDFYDLDEIKYTEPSAKRLLDIINFGYGYNFKKNDLKRVFELKHKKNSKFHLFVYIDNGYIKAILIDFFHLGINADLIINEKIRKKIKLEDIYNKQKENKCDLIELTKI